MVHAVRGTLGHPVGDWRHTGSVRKVHIRLPEALYEELRDRAAEQGISLNGLMVVLLAGSIGFRLGPSEGSAAP